MKPLRLTILALACLAAATPLQAAPTVAQASELKSQAEALSQKLDQVPQATSPQAKAALASQHWQRMQDYMRSFPGMGCLMCGSMMGSMMMGRTAALGGAMGSGMMQRPGMHGGMMGGNMMGCPLMGGDGSGWQMPTGMTPSAYHSSMAAHMMTMRGLLSKAQATTDPVERDRFTQEAWNGMYRNMQTMRGMGWMWTPAEQARVLPDRKSQGVQLVGSYCSQCYAAPSPTLHSASEWSAVASRMRGHMQDAGGAGQGVKIPTAGEFDEIVEYLGQHAR